MSLGELAIQRFPTRHLLLAAAMIVQRVGADTQAGPVIKGDRRINALAVDECAIR